MRILIAVDDFFLDRPGGMGRVAWDIALGMRDSGHQVAMLSCLLPSVGNATSVSDIDGIQVVRYVKPTLPSWHPRRAESAINAAAEATQANLSDQPWDVIHMHSLFTGTGVIRALGKEPRYVYTMHSPVVLEQQINWRNQGLVGRLKVLFGMRALQAMEGRLLQSCVRIHTLSDFTRSWVERFHGLGDKVTVVPHWNRPELRRTMTKAAARRHLGWPLDKKVLFTIRHLGPRYGLDVAIKAISPLTVDGSCKFFIGGEGMMRPILEQLILEHGASDQIRLLGRLSDDQLHMAYQAADLFVLPTLALECFGLISLEAMAFGCPVIATDVGAIPEVLRPILPDCLVPPGDVNALRARIQQFLCGTLPIPEEESLVAYVHQNYGREVVWPRLHQLITGNSESFSALSARCE